MLLRRPGCPLTAQGTQGSDQLQPGFVREDDAIHVATLGCQVGVREGVGVFVDQFRASSVGIVVVGELLKEADATRGAAASAAPPCRPPSFMPAATAKNTRVSSRVKAQTSSV